MKKSISLLITMGLVTAAIVTSCDSKETKPSGASSAAITDDSLVKRGSYLVAVNGCDHCHTPKKMGPQGPEPDIDRRFGGHPANEPLPPIDTNSVKNGWVNTNMGLTAWIGPWGLSYGANISSDDTGLGSWSEAQFKKAFTEGKWKGMDGSRMLLPPMPWQDFKHFTDEDVKAIYLYLKSSKPVNNIVPPVKAFADLK